MTTDLDEVRRMLAPALEDDTGPRYSPEEVLKSARRATAQRRAVVASALSVGVVLAIGAGVLAAVTGPSTVESAGGAVLSAQPNAARVVPTTPEHAAALTGKLQAANVIPAGFGITTTLSAADVPPLHFRPVSATSADGYQASAVLTDAAGSVTLTLHVKSAASPEDCTPGNPCSTDNPMKVTRRARPTLTFLPDGVQVTAETDYDNDLPGLISVGAHLPDGTVVHATIRADVEVVHDGKRWFQTSTRDRVPFTDQQLIEMIKKPGFSYQP